MYLLYIVLCKAGLKRQAEVKFLLCLLYHCHASPMINAVPKDFDSKRTCALYLITQLHNQMSGFIVRL